MRYALAVVAATLTVAGLSRPDYAGGAIQLLVVCTTVTVVAVIAHRRWSDLDPQVLRPFVPPEPQATSGVETPDVTELVRAVESSGGRLPTAIAKRLAEAVRGRLADRHRLQFYSDADRDAIEALLSPTMWALLNTRPDDTVDVPLRDLNRLLDEVEAL